MKLLFKEAGKNDIFNKTNKLYSKQIISFQTFDKPKAKSAKDKK